MKWKLFGVSWPGMGVRMRREGGITCTNAPSDVGLGIVAIVYQVILCAMRANHENTPAAMSSSVSHAIGNSVDCVQSFVVGECAM